jgi:hypothetical protein
MPSAIEKFKAAVALVTRINPELVSTVAILEHAEAIVDLNTRKRTTRAKKGTKPENGG